MRKNALLICLFFVGIACLYPQNTTKNYRIYYEEIIEASSSTSEAGKAPPGSVAIASTLIISVAGYPDMDKIYSIVGQQLGYSPPGTEFDYYVGDLKLKMIVSKTKWIRKMSYLPAKERVRFLELRITNYEAL